MRLKPNPAWKLLPRPDLFVERSDEPVILDLGAAVKWITNNKPILWVGSIFSVPEPSRFPSGYALTRSLFDLIIPEDDENPDFQREALISYLTPRWPLEALFDEFERLNCDIDPVLKFFSDWDKHAEPNPLHMAITSYYERGLSAAPLCVTTNWDSMIEKAFRGKGYSVEVGGPAKVPLEDFGKPHIAERTMFVYHPHGSFECEDVVCSSFQEQQQLSLHIGWKFHPMLVLGYSGYEPSLYRQLEISSPQLWCIRDKDDLRTPSKRRLMCRRGTFVYIGDLRELLRELQLLEKDVNFRDNNIRLRGEFSQNVVKIIQCAITSQMHPQFCSELLADAICSNYEEPEMTSRLFAITRALDNHIRDRCLSPELALGLMTIAGFRNDEIVWVSLLAYLLRRKKAAGKGAVDLVLGYADEARKQRETFGLSKDFEGAYQLLRYRARFYKGFLGKSESVADDVRNVVQNQMPWMAMGDMALGAELTELAAFSCLFHDDDARALGYFDTAATYFYLVGLWNAGAHNEWACRNLAEVREYAKKYSLRIPMPTGKPN